MIYSLCEPLCLSASNMSSIHNMYVYMNHDMLCVALLCGNMFSICGEKPLNMCLGSMKKRKPSVCDNVYVSRLYCYHYTCYPHHHPVSKLPTPRTPLLPSNNERAINNNNEKADNGRKRRKAEKEAERRKQ